MIVDLIGLSFASAGLIPFEMTLLVGFGWRGWASFKKPSKTTFMEPALKIALGIYALL